MSANNASWRRYPSRGASTITQIRPTSEKRMKATISSQDTNSSEPVDAGAVHCGCELPGGGCCAGCEGWESVIAVLPRSDDQDSLRAVPFHIKRPPREVCDVDASPPFVVKFEFPDSHGGSVSRQTCRS